MLMRRKKVSENVSVEHRDGISILSVKNDLSYQTADQLKAAYPQVQSDKILVDLGQIRITTSRGLAALFNWVIRQIEQDKTVSLCNLSTHCLNIIDAMNLVETVKEVYTRDLEVFDSLDEGRAYLQGV